MLNKRRQTVDIGRMLAALFLVVPFSLATLHGWANGQGSPIVEAVKPISQETKTEFKFTIKAQSLEASELRFSLQELRKDREIVPIPGNVKLDAKTGDFLWTPTAGQAGSYELLIAVQDAKGRNATTTVHLSVRDRPITTASGPIGDLLRKWHAEGTAAGNTGDYYDNRDRDHSALNLGPYPQLDVVTYTEAERKGHLDWALQPLLLPQVTFGNSSTSASVLRGGSNVRSYYTHPIGMEFLYEQYRSNNLYMYPGHHDHHPGHNGKPFYGDVYPANSPYLITSQGSSGTDQPFMRAVPFTLAAFRPEVKKKLRETGLLMPALQMIFRSTNKHLASPQEYLTGKAHPTVFEGSWVNDLQMVQRAHEIELNNLLPMIQLRVVEEDAAVEGKDYFEPGRVEKLHDTPAAIARVVRGGDYRRRMVVSAEDSFDLNQRPLNYHWKVLRGDAERIAIKPLNDAASVVELLVPYPERRPVIGPVPLESNRVDIGAFVHNGSYYSAPGFVTFFGLDSEARTYDEHGRLLEIGYGAGDADLRVTDWKALFAALQTDADDWPARLLRQSLKAEELAAIRKASDDYQTANDSLAEARAKHKDAAAMRDKVKAAKASAEDLKAAEAALQAAQKVVDAATKAVNDVVNLKRAGLDQPIKNLIENNLGKLKDQPLFAIEHQPELMSLIQAAPPARKSQFTAARQRLIGLGILKPSDDHALHLQPLRSGSAPLAERLTRYETNLLQRFNAEALSGLMYPQFLGSSFQVNFVDQRLSTPKAWRDVYRYDTQGKRLGWTRYDGKSTQEFNADGQAILEKDKLGRALKTRTVEYVYDPPLNLFDANRLVKQVWGGQVTHFEYLDDNDRTGRIKKQETVEAR